MIYEDVDKAIERLCRVFGFTERLRANFNGVVVHAPVTFGDGAIMIGRQGDSFRSPGHGEVNAYAHVTVDDVNTHFERTKRNSARIIESPTDMLFGEREYTAEDFAGHGWRFSQHIADVSPDSWGATAK